MYDANLSTFLQSDSLTKGPFPGYDGDWHGTKKLCEKICKNSEGSRYEESE